MVNANHLTRHVALQADGLFTLPEHGHAILSPRYEPSFR